MEKFYLDLDIGSNSVGTACTDENYNLLRVKGKDCWSVRLFEESATAADCRGYRTGRRRNERRKRRIGWLQALFAPFIEDKTFFIRLNNSQFFPEDKDEFLGGDKNNLFSGIYDDKAFHAEFPTVYHLRERLITEGRADLLFPRQINQTELVKIVDGMVKFHPETKLIADKILPSFLFRVPYFVGPLMGKNSWAVRSGEKKDEKITPWNFNEVIDFAASNEEFMRRMTNKCSYLRGEGVLPKNSVIYQKFDVLNQLNKLKVNGCAISVEIKKKIFDELFLSLPKVSDRKIKDLLVREGVLSAAEAKDATLKGKDGEFKASASSFVRLKKILGEFVDKDYAENGGVCENIILWHTLNTDKTIVEKLILKNYGNIPVIKENIKQLKGLSFNDFGRLSQKFLTGIRAVDKRTGELVTVLEVLYETNENLNEILFDENYDFGNRITEENGETSSEVTYADIEDLYVSPSVRRGIWQSLVIADEYVNAIGKTPDKIFIEVTR